MVFRFPSNSSMCAMDEVQQVVAAQCAYWLEGVLLVRKYLYS